MPVETPGTTANHLHAAKHARELQLLYRIAQTLASRSGQTETLSEILDTLEQELGMSRGTVMLLSPDDEELAIEAARNIQAERRHEVRYRRGEGIIGDVLTTGRSRVIPRISQEPAFRDRIHRRQESQNGDSSFMCVPIAGPAPRLPRPQ